MARLIHTILIVLLLLATVVSMYIFHETDKATYYLLFTIFLVLIEDKIKE